MNKYFPIIYNVELNRSFHPNLSPSVCGMTCKKAALAYRFIGRVWRQGCGNYRIDHIQSGLSVFDFKTKERCKAFIDLTIDFDWQIDKVQKWTRQIMRIRDLVDEGLLVKPGRRECSE